MPFIDSTTMPMPTMQFLLRSNITFDEIKVAENIKAHNVEHLAIASFQLAAHGWTKKEFGNVFIDGKLISVKEILETNGVNIEAVSQDKLVPDELTPSRLVRLFRYQIRDHFEKEGIISFLERKYGDNERTYIFPGAEYLIDDPDKAFELMTVYEAMDERLNTKFYESAMRVFAARRVNCTGEEDDD